MSDPFEMKATSGGETEIPPAGMTPAALVAMIDLGTQKRDYQGTISWDRQIFLVWELTTQKMTGLKDTNHVIGQDYTLKFGPKSNLRAIVAKWRGKDFEDNEPFNLNKLLGQKCILTLVHKTGSKDRTFCKIDGIGPAKGWPNPIPDPQRKPFAWKLGQGQPPSEDWLPRIYGELVADRINRCQELNGDSGYQPSSTPAANGAHNPAPQSQPVGAGPSDEAPF